MPIEMNDEILTALETSIKHWEENAEAENFYNADLSPSSCALCEKFRLNVSLKACRGCPIEIKTGRINCAGTPYADASHAYEVWSNDVDESNDPKHRAAFQAAARAEVEFLKSLRPEAPIDTDI